MKNFNKLHLLTLEKARMLKKGIAFLMILTIGFSSCKKEIDNYGLLKNGKKENTHIQKLTLSDIEKHVANPLNPMDEIGRLHNEGMKAVITDELVQSKNDPAVFKKLLNEYAKKEGVNIEQFNENFEAFLLESNKINSYLKNNNIVGYYKELLNNQKINNNQFKYLEKLVVLIDGLQSIVNSNNGELLSSYLDLNKQIKGIELELMNDKSFNNHDEKNIIYMASSIYRYSMYNYLDVISDKENPLYSILVQTGDTVIYTGDSTPTVRLVADWGAVGHADVSGGLGGLASAGIGYLFITVTWPIVAAMGFGGAVGMSVAELYNQFVNGTAYFIEDIGTWW